MQEDGDPKVDLERGVVQTRVRVRRADRERVGMASRVVAGGRRAAAALITHGCRPDRDARHPCLYLVLDFESASTPRPLGEDTEDFYELFDRDDEREE